jgi:hypothetical protein
MICCVTSWSQEKEVIKYNDAINTREEFANSTMKYPQFIKGTALLKNGTTAHALFNYNYGTNEVLFINPQNDTLALAVPEQYSYIIIATDTFSHSKYGFLQLIRNTPSCRLFLKRSLGLIDAEKKGAYGGYSNTSASTALNSIPNGTGMHPLSTDENLIYSYRDSYFLADRFNNFYPATQKGMRDFAWKNQKEVKDFIDKNKINFEKKEDLNKLIDFVLTIEQN